MSEASPDLRAAIWTLARLSRVLEAADAGVTVPQFRMLATLNEGGQRSARLAERLAIRKPTATALADGLVAAGYAERESEDGDRRIVRLCITDAGRAALERAESAYTEKLEPLLDDLDDRGRFLADLATVTRTLDARLEAKLTANVTPR
jgi:DNA-binding MarR family transcriptional regulator